MAGDKREVRVAVVGDADQLARELKKAEGRLTGFGDNARSAGDTLRTALFGGAVLYGAKRLVDAAANLEQSIGGTAAVFKDASGPVNEFAKNAADLAGLSENTARTLTSRLGASLKGTGMSAEDAAKQAVFLTQTGADLAATLGGTTDEAVTALGAALRGEYDPLERFGITLKASEVAAKAVSMGLADSETNVSAYAKSQATLALITEGSAFAQKQFAKEADTAQGQAARAAAKTEDASAKLGKTLLPIYTKIQEVIALVATAFSALPGPVQTGLIGLTAVALVGPKLVEGFTLATTAVRQAGTAMADLAARAVSTQGAIASLNMTSSAAGGGAAAAAGGMALLGPATLAVGAAAVIGGIAWKSYSDEQAAVAKDIKTLSDSFEELTGKLTDETTAKMRSILESKNQIDNLNKAGVSVEQFTDVIDDNRDALVKQGKVEGLLQLQLENGTDKIRDQIQAIRDRGGAQNDLIARLLETGAADKGLIATLYNGIDAYNQQQEIIRQLNIQKSISAGLTEEEATAQANLQAEVDKVNDKLKKQLEALLDLNDAKLSLEEAEIKARAQLVEYNKSLSDGSLSADQRRQSEIDLQKSMEGAAAKAREAAVAQAELEGKTLSQGQAAKVQSDKLNELAQTLAPGNPVRKNLEDLAYQLFLLSLQDPVVKVRVETEQALRQFRYFLLELGLDPYGQIGLGEILSFGNRWTGGTVNQGSPYIVGEKGPELFVPSSYGRIMDAFSTGKAMLNNIGGGDGMGDGGNTYNISVNVAPGSDKAAVGQSIVETIAAYERRSGTGWRS